MNALKVSISPLEAADIPEVLEIEKTVDPSPWAESSFKHEVETNKLAYYFVARHDGKIVGYAGYWLVIDEVHITKVATHLDFRRQKIGEQLLTHLLESASQQGATRGTLELRESNEPARKLYEKFGFSVSGTRKHYYLDNLENATIMWKETL